MTMEYKKEIEEINAHISDALKDWSDILLKANADGWEYLLDFDNKDLFNALYIFNSVWQNNAIKRGVLNDENAVYRIKKFQKALEECFEINTFALDK